MRGQFQQQEARKIIFPGAPTRQCADVEHEAPLWTEAPVPSEIAFEKGRFELRVVSFATFSLCRLGSERSFELRIRP